MDPYAEQILELYKHPIFKERLTSPTVSATKNNPSCGDALEVDLLLENNTVAQVGWDGVGCAISQASMSLLSEEITGKSIADVLNLREEEIIKLLQIEISPRRRKCAILGLQAVKAALQTIEK